MKNLAKLDDEARMIVESNMDTILKDPKTSEAVYGYILTEMGIEPNLETLLSYVVGEMFGVVAGYVIQKYDRAITSEERKELSGILRRRALELRDALIRTRIEPT